MATKTKGAKRGRPSRRPAARTRSRPQAQRQPSRARKTRVPVSAEPEPIDEEVKEDIDELEGDHGPQPRMGGYGGYSEPDEEEAPGAGA